jgi:hypothetical protein
MTRRAPGKDPDHSADVAKEWWVGNYRCLPELEAEQQGKQNL